MDSVVAPEQRACDGFVLRSYREGDGERLAEAVNESYEHLRPWMPWARPHQTAEASERLVRQFRARYLLAEDFVIGIFSADGLRLLGGGYCRNAASGPAAWLMAIWAAVRARP
ncbi:MAG: hypothetical protein PVI30_12975 [Myxococcales bacterium]|jgi:hypothetical protein